MNPGAPGSPSGDTTVGRLSLLLVLTCVAVVHFTSLSGTYVFDDMSVFEDEAFENVLDFEWFSLTYRPLGRFSFAVQFLTIGRSVEASHFVNIVIHLLAVAGLFRLVEFVAVHTLQIASRTEARLLAGACSLLWGVHPLTTNVVTYVIQRYESLAAMLIIWSLYFWLSALCVERRHVSDKVEGEFPIQWLRLAAACACGLGAMATKEIAAGLPLILALASAVFVRHDPKMRKLGYAIAMAMAIPVIYGAYLRGPGLFAEGSRATTIGFNLPGINALDYVAVQPLIYLRYLKLLILPTDLVLDYGWIPQTLSRWIWLGWLGWVAIAVGLVLAWRYRPRVAFGLTGAILVLATTSLIPTQDVIFEHRFYLPAAVLIAIAVLAAWKRVQHHASLAVASVIIVSVFFSLATVKRNSDYVSVRKLSISDLSRQPENPRTIVRIAAENLESSNELELAMRKAYKLSSDRGYFYKGSGYFWARSIADLLMFRNEFAEAEVWYERALVHSNRAVQDAEVLLSMAVISSLTNEPQEAEQRFEKALSLETTITPNVLEAYEEHKRRAAQR